MSSRLRGITHAVIRLIALGTVPHNRRPTAAWGWLCAIFLFPVPGSLVYLVLGRAQLPKSRRKKQAGAAQLVDPHGPGTGAEDIDLDRMPDWLLETTRLNNHNGAFSLTGGNRVEILSDYNGCLEEIAEQIRGARSWVHFQFYIAVSDETTEPVVRALEDAHRRGVTVRVLIDHLGSAGYPGYQQLVRRLDTAGIDWRRTLPVRPWRGQYQRPDLRNHRKIMVVDGRVAFAGSQNMIDRSYNKKRNKDRGLQWVSLMLRLQGPAVEHLDAVFATDWYCETDELIQERASEFDPAPTDEKRGDVLCQVLPSGPGLAQENNLQMFNHLFASAKKRITICSPYFIPDKSMYSTLRTAVGRGVEVRLYTGETSSHIPTLHAQRSFYEPLLLDGIRIFLYPAPYVLHAKCILIDDNAAVVGSANMDIRSFVLDHEINLLLAGADVVAELDKAVDDYHRNSNELNLKEWQARPWHQKYLDNIARMTSPLQ